MNKMEKINIGSDRSIDENVDSEELSIIEESIFLNRQDVDIPTMNDTPEQSMIDKSIKETKSITETFCTNWKCINHNVKLVTLKGDEVIISDLRNND